MSVPPARRRVVVVGGGPAGLEAARVAADRGHSVRLLEQRAGFGGAVRDAAAGAGRQRLSLLVDWLENECRLQGVQLQAGIRAGAELLSAGGADVILATGSVAGRRTYAVADALADTGARAGATAAQPAARRSCPPATSCTWCGRTRRPP